MAIKAGDVVIVPFPFRDRLEERPRPAVVVSCQLYNQGGDLVVAAVTSRGPRSTWDYALADWSQAGLQIPSTVRMLLGTTAEQRVFRYVGRLSDRDWLEVQARIRRLFTWP